MSLFKKFKKSRQPSQHLALGIPTQIAVGPLGIHADLNPEIGPEGAFCLGVDLVYLITALGPDDGKGSRVVVREVNVNQRPSTSGLSTTNPGLEDNGTRGSILLQLMRPMLAILITVHDQNIKEKSPRMPRTGPPVRSSLISPPLSRGNRRSGMWGKLKTKGKSLIDHRMHPLNVRRRQFTPVRTHKTLPNLGGQRVSVGALALLHRINAYQSQKETGRRGLSAVRRLCSMLPGAPPKPLVPSRQCWNPSPLSMLNTRFVYFCLSEVHSEQSTSRKPPLSRIRLIPSVCVSPRWRRFSRSPPTARPRKGAAKNY